MGVRRRNRSLVTTGSAALGVAVMALGVTQAAHAQTGDAAAGADAGSCRRHVALSFDDGPDNSGAAASPAYGTNALLDGLASRQVRATFFLIGRKVVNDPDAARRIRAAGHVIGNHTMNHRDMTLMTYEVAKQEVRQAQTVIKGATGATPTLGRSPFGRFNATVDRAFASVRLARSNWAVESYDWRPTATVAGVQETVLARVNEVDGTLASTGSAEGIIVLMHDNGVATAAAVPGIIDSLRAGGYCFGKMVPSRTFSEVNRGYAAVVPW
ncbi:MAG: polysaccharide deacetylase family protein [Austwickia sp.]|nr:polysaccharide deacetylase family protein [Austwickia sp.]MBK8434953.1 polysaccharide deacetylase family protein [Austwickia sp.]MBK9101489.1 polysaccharide deacetylase family protein [Austwickia sp.]